MNTKYRNYFSLAGLFGSIMLFNASTPAQIQRPPIFMPTAQRCQAVPSVYIRNLRYDDYTRYARLSSNTVTGGGYLQITTRCIPFDGQIVVTLQDANRPNGSSGVTAFRLTNVTRSGNTVYAQVPNYPIFKNRTFHVGLFVYGQPWKTANPGYITIQ